MGAPGTARARARTALTREILDVARRQLATVGAAGLSLRAVAHELEMVPSGLYRYFASRDVLLTALIVEAYTAVGDQAESALAQTRDSNHRDRWCAVCTSVRDWAVAHPQEFALIYGSPVPDYRAPTDTVAPSARVYTLLLGILSDSARAGLLAPPSTQAPLPTTLAEDAAALLSALNFSDLTPEVLLRGITAWTQILGALSQELFGHLGGAFRTNADLFTHTVELTADLVGLAPRR
ncbi:TetR/AcrR family transcriptional regulator [Glaciihabitans sp. UYNi722]|uniref:TetR/AcrR family transcriptional regulator n=1 Tax=Glaciihabitans sp. UYNi722 TaxID=3156344 RepID=UPI003393701E